MKYARYRTLRKVITRMLSEFISSDLPFLLPQMSNENALPHPFVVGGYRASFSRRKGNVNGPIEVRHANDGRSLSPAKDLFQQSREDAI
jgi:hypothetical protein